MGNSLSYDKLPEELQQKINELYKSYKCRYDYLKTLEPTTVTIKELYNIQNEFNTFEKGKVHHGKRLKDIIPREVKAKLDADCNKAMKKSAITDETMQTLIQKRNDIAEQIKEFMFSETSKKYGLTEMRHIKTDGGSKKSRSKKHRSKKHRSKKHRSKKHKSRR